MTTPESNPRRGFALLLVFVLAASIAIFLYLQIPRAAFESQRAKEEVLIQCGEQYKRAIQLFVRKNNKYPADMDALENTNGIRYLRRRYKDPMTGKDEWRLVHVGPGGVLTDSINSKKKGPLDKDDKEKKSENTFITEMVGVGETAQQAGQPVNLALRQRPSDRAGAPGSNPAAPGTGVAPPPEGEPPALAAGDVQVPPQYPPQPGQPVFFSTYPQGQPGQPGQQPAQPGASFPAQPGQPGQPYPQVPGFPGFPTRPPTASAPGGQRAPGGYGVGISGGMISGSGYPGSAPQPGGTPSPFGAPSAGGPGAPNPGLDMIQRILTTPRPGGLPGAGNPGQTIGGGIAGVATKYEGDSIKVYKERQKYQEWEFIYDIKDDIQKKLGGGLNPQGANPLGARSATQQSGASPASGIQPR